MPPLLRTLAAQIIALVLGLLLTVQLVSFLVLRDGIDRNAQGTLITELRKGERVWRRLTDDLSRPLGETAARLAGSDALRAALAAADKDGLATAVGAQVPAGSARRVVLLDDTGQPRFTQGTDSAKLLDAWRELAARGPALGMAIVWLDRTPYWVAASALAGPPRTPVQVQGPTQGQTQAQTPAQVLVAEPLPPALLEDARTLTSLTYAVLLRRRGEPWQEAWTTQPPSRRTAAVLQALAPDERIPVAGREWQFQVGEQWLGRAIPMADVAGAGVESAVVILRSMDEAAAPFTRLQITLAALMGLGAVVTVTGGILLARRMTRPLLVLAEAARRLGRGDYERPIAVTATHEVSELAGALEVMRAGIRERDSRITQLAYTDPLTNLPNRQQFLRLVGHRFKPSTQTPGGCALLVLNLDRFRLVNEALGRAFGDRLLREVGKRLSEVRAHGKNEADNDVVARLGADTFAVLLAKSEPEAVQAARQKIERAFERPVRLDEHRIDLSAAIGAAIGPEHGSEADLLVGRAEMAMQLAKREHLGFQVFSSTMDTATPAALSLLGELRQALDKQQLRLFLQPRVNLRSEKVIGAEALLRWQHPRRGLLQPTEFITFAEQTGFVRQLTAWVLDAAACAARDLQDAGLNLRVSLNLSARDLRDDLPARVRDALQQHGLQGNALSLEITETAMMDEPQRALRTLKMLADMGVHLSIDDFGTGFSSLSYLKRLPVHELKIDKSFVMRMEYDLDDAKIVHSTIALAHNLGLGVVAEGVETAAAWKLLAALRCDQAQGFLIAAPMPADEFAGWCRQWRAPDTEDVDLTTDFREMI
ncbi:MAG TPA: EAL domain-containing protein [Burkholderiaceae bacterium]|nr:EAL domain-containing protein [Burkholderiaceae bacterium]